MSGVVICKECGNESTRDEQFCEACGTYLGWWGEHVDTSAETIVAAEEQAEAVTQVAVASPPASVQSTRPTMWRRFSSRMSLTPGSGGRSAAAGARLLLKAGTVAVTPYGWHGNGRAPVAAPSLQRPGKEAVRRPPRTLRQAWGRVVAGVICMSCKQMNPRGAHFCRNCGAVLVGTPPVVVTRWQSLTRRPAFLEAGQRPGWTKVVAEGPRRIPRRVAVIAGAVLLVLALVVFGAWLWARSVGNWTGRVAHNVRLDVYPYYTPIKPAKVSGIPRPKKHPKTKIGRDLKRHPVEDAFDRDLTTYWQAPPTLKQKPPTGIGAQLIVRIKPARNLDRVAIFAGDPAGEKLVPSRLQLGYKQSGPRQERPLEIRRRGRDPRICKPRCDHQRHLPRPAQARYRDEATARPLRMAPGQEGHWKLVGSDAITLANRPGYQRFKIRAGDVGLVRIAVKGVYDAEAPGTASITELEFFNVH